MDQLYGYKEKIPEVFQEVVFVNHRPHLGLSWTGNLQHNVRMNSFTSKLNMLHVISKGNERERTT